MSEEKTTPDQGFRDHSAGLFKVVTDAVKKLDDPAALTVIALYALALVGSVITRAPGWCFVTATTLAVTYMIMRVEKIRVQQGFEMKKLQEDTRVRQIEARVALELALQKGRGQSAEVIPQLPATPEA